MRLSVAVQHQAERRAYEDYREALLAYLSAIHLDSQSTAQCSG